MKVKINNKIYDADKQPIMLIFSSEKERKNIVDQINAMDKEATKYCIFPATKKWTKNNYKAIKEWMNNDE